MKLLKRIFQKKNPEVFLPSNVKSLLERKEKVYGPNCWNATIMFHDKTKNEDHVEESEMNHWLRENTVIVNDYLMNGDILVIRNGRELWHTAIFLTNDMMFHKIGCNGPYRIESEKQVKAHYNEAKNYEWRRVIKKEEKAA